MKNIHPIKKLIPKFTNREDEAKFWESHSTSELLSELKPVKAHFSQKLSAGLHIRLDMDTLRKLRQKAKIKGIGPTTLVRMWVLEQINPV
jgi:hypothetical protein